MKVKSESEIAQSCLTLCNPMDCSLPDSSVHGIFQARVLEWVAITFSISGWALHPIPFSLMREAESFERHTREEAALGPRQQVKAR